mmetsp:Transcript_53081/g.104761  ORF Transcript_53081/g.104761 Transcript_53081/m.104761 type:complete len:311 (+) Transcript_53081:617-1549(+)
MDGVVVVRVQRLENLPGFLIRDVELVDHDLPQLHECDCACVVCVHGDEIFPHLCALLVRQRPCHDVHADPPKLRRTRELPQGLDDAVIHLHLGVLGGPHSDPLMVQGLLSGQTLARIQLQQFLHEVDTLRRDAAPPFGLHSVFAGHDVRPQHFVRPRERHVSAEQHKNNNAQAPQIALEVVVPGEHLRSDVRQRSATDVHVDVRLPHFAETEIDQLQVIAVLAVVQEVLHLEVPMDDTVAVEVVQGDQHLLGRVRRMRLRETLALDHAVEELPALQAFHDQVQELVGLIHVVEPRNVRVIHPHEHGHFGL